MKKLVNFSTVGQKLLITRRVDGKLVKAQVFLNPKDAYVFKTPPDLLGSTYLEYYKALRSLGVMYIEDEDEAKEAAEVVHSEVTEADPFEIPVIIEDQDAVTKDYVETESSQNAVVVPTETESDQAALIGFLESTYNKVKLIEMADSLNLDTSGTKSEIATRIVESNYQFVVNLMSK